MNDTDSEKGLEAPTPAPAPGQDLSDDPLRFIRERLYEPLTPEQTEVVMRALSRPPRKPSPAALRAAKRYKTVFREETGP